MDLLQKQQVFAREYEEIFRFLYRYVCYRIPSKEEAEDVVAEVVANGFAKLDQYDPLRGALVQWMTGFARHAVQMYWRSRKATVSLEDVLNQIPDIGHVAVIDALDHRLAVSRVLRGLSPETKSLLALRYEDDLTYQEIAEMLGKEAAAVRKFFSRLHGALRSEIEDEPSVYA